MIHVKNQLEPPLLPPNDGAWVEMRFRVFDILISGLAIFLLSPILLLSCLVVYLFGEGDIFYLQRRSGKAGAQFDVIKFATMQRDSPEKGAGLFVVHNDSRILPHGRLFRSTKLNELPQLLNVLLGDMSLVGFRPLVPSTFDRAVSLSSGAGYKVQPGLTSLASIVGRNEELELGRMGSREKFYFEYILPRKVMFDDWWAEHRSLKLYFGILLATAMVVVAPTNAVPRWLKRVSGLGKALDSTPEALGSDRQ